MYDEIFCFSKNFRKQNGNKEHAQEEVCLRGGLWRLPWRPEKLRSEKHGASKGENCSLVTRAPLIVSFTVPFSSHFCSAPTWVLCFGYGPSHRSGFPGLCQSHSPCQECPHHSVSCSAWGLRVEESSM